MKKLTLIVCSLLAVATSFAVAGSETCSTHDSKTVVNQTQTESLYNQGEFQVDVFGAFGHKYTRNTNVVAGGGLGANYFFTRNFGLGIDGYILDTAKPTGEAAGTLIARLPLGNSHFAPYAVAGGGAIFNGVHSHDAKAFAKGGLGLEYRFSPHVGIMTDYTYNMVEGSHNNFGVLKTGLKFVF